VAAHDHLVGQLPSGGKQLLEQRLAGREPQGMLVVSLIGYVPDWLQENPVLMARPGHAYDWRIVAGLTVMLLTKQGMAGTVETMLQVAKVIQSGSLFAWDVERECGCDLWARPRLSDIALPVAQWHMELDAEPWERWQNDEFITGHPCPSINSRKHHEQTGNL
jgi:hypothetical protein